MTPEHPVVNLVKGDIYRIQKFVSTIWTLKIFLTKEAKQWQVFHTLASLNTQVGWFDHWSNASAQIFFIFTKGQLMPNQDNKVLSSIRQFHQSLKNTSCCNCADWQFWIFISILRREFYLSFSSLPSNPFVGVFLS